MSKSMTGSMQCKIGWNLSDTAGVAGGALSENISIDAIKQLAAGVGDGQVNVRWSSSRSLAGSTSETLDLTALAETITDKNITRQFINIKELFIVNDSPDNALRVGAAGSNVFLGPLGGTAPTQDVAKLSRLLWENGVTGFTVDSTHKNLKVANLGATATAYRIVILGVDETGIPSSSSSSS